MKHQRLYKQFHNHEKGDRMKMVFGLKNQITFIFVKNIKIQNFDSN
jgi:hypothetical protein